MSLRITCLGHSGFALESGDGSVTVITDYYTDPCHQLESVMARAQQVYVMVSHSHRDHLCHDIFEWHDQFPVVRYIIANECRRKLGRCLDLTRWPFTFMHQGDDWSDGKVTVHAFGSTDIGVSFIIGIDGKQVFHAGDFTCWLVDDATENARRKALGDFRAILRTIAAYTPHLDVALMPVVPNLGRDFALGARELLRAVQCDLFIPMHMWGRDREATQFDLYLNPAHGECRYVPEGTSTMF